MGRPVLLVHGLLGQRHLYWNVLRRRLRAAGCDVHEANLPVGLLGNLHVAAQALRDRVEEVQRDSGADRVDLVCHSGGGLIARYALKFLGLERRLHTVVCMGTPHQGTYFASLFPFAPIELRRQSLPGSAFLGEIADVPGPDSPVRFVNLWSPLDAVVVPYQSAQLPHAENVELPWATHWSFLWRRDVHEAVLRALHGGPLGAAARRAPSPRKERRTARADRSAARAT